MTANVSHRRIWIHFLVLGLYAALAVVLTWPLIQHLSTHVPGSYTWAFDEYTFLWNMWWFRYSLFNLGQNPLYSTHTFYPVGISLALYTYHLFNDVVSLPLQPFLSLPAISNLLFLFSTVLSGYGAFLLVHYLLRTTLPGDAPRPTQPDSRLPTLDSRLPYLAAFLSGLLYAFGSYRMVYAALGHYNLWSTTWIPFYTLYLMRSISEPRLRNAVMAGIFMVLLLLCDMMLGVFAGVLTVILVVTALAGRSRARLAGSLPGLFKRLAIIGLVALILYLPVLIPVLKEIRGGYELAGWGDAQKLSVDLVGLFTPTALHPLGGDWVETLRQTREGTARFQDVNTVFLGWTGLALAIVGAVRYRRQLSAWIASLIILVLFSLGPLLQINGRSQFDLDGLTVNVPLPFILLHYIPLVKANRVPNRFSVVLMLALAVLAGFGAYWLLTKAASSRRPVGKALLATISALLLALLLFDHWSAPLPTTDAHIPPAYAQVAADGEDYAILQLPLGWRNGFGQQGAESTQTQYYQSYHHKRLLSGNTSRNPPFKFDYFQRVPILDSLITLETYGQVDAQRRAADRATAGEFVDFYDIRYVAVAPATPGRPPYEDTRDAAVAYTEEVLPVEKLYDRDGWLLYRVNQPPAPMTLTVDFGASEPLTSMALGEGWAEGELIQGVSANWAVTQGARVFVPAVIGSNYRLSLTALPFDYPGAAPQTVALQVNGHRLEPLTMSSGWNSYQWAVPSALLRPGLNDLRFEFGRLAAPADVLPGNGAIGATGVQAPVAIEVNSGGPADFAYITVGTGDQAEDASLHSPGYNVAEVDPRTGRVIDRGGFDTTPGGSEAQAAALADWIAAVPNGRIVIAAMQGDGTAHLTDEAVAALRSIGGQADPRSIPGGSHAVIGVKGAAPGAALEAAGPGNGWLRIAPDRRTLAMAVDSLTWEPASP